MEEQMEAWAATPVFERRQNLKIAGCGGVFSQLFDWNRVLGNKSISTRFLGPDPTNWSIQREAEVGRQTVSKPILRNSRSLSAQNGPRSQEGHEVMEASMAETIALEAMAGSSGIEAGAETPKELRQLLHVQQEPFVLQDLLKEKSQPQRRRANADRSCEDYSAGEARRSHTSRKLKVGDSRICQAEAKLCLEPPKFSMQTKRAPAESIVATPSSHLRGKFAAKSHLSPTKSDSKVSSPSKSTCKSPNKKALLMEAASKILEGSNRSRTALAARRSLVLESKHASSDAKTSKKSCKSRSVRKSLSLKHECAVKSETWLGQEAVSNKKHASRAIDQDLASKRSVLKHEKDCNSQSRVFPYDRSLSSSGKMLATLASPSQCMVETKVSGYSKVGSRPFYGRFFSSAKERKNGDQRSQIRGRAISSPRLRKSTAEDSQIMGTSCRTDPEITATLLADATFSTTERYQQFELEAVGLERPHPFSCQDEGERGECAKDIDFLVEAPNIVKGVTEKFSLDRDARRSKEGMASIAPGSSPHFRETRGNVNICQSILNHTESFVLGGLHIENDDRYKSTLCSGLQKGTDCKVHCHVRSSRAEMGDAAFMNRRPSLPKLCDFSWWEREDHAQKSTQEVQQKFQDLLCCDQFSQDSQQDRSCETLKSPLLFLKVGGDTTDGRTLEGQLPTHPDFTCLEDFQQCSPVSVLDATFEQDSPTLDKSLASFQEARQQLLDKVRRYELLAQMDIETLLNYSELDSSLEEEEDLSTSCVEEVWDEESDAANISITSNQHQADISTLDYPDFGSQWTNGGDEYHAGIEEDVQEHENDYLARFLEETSLTLCKLDTKRRVEFLQEAHDQDIQSAQSPTTRFDLKDKFEEGETEILSCDLVECVKEALKPLESGVPNCIMETHSWEMVSRDMSQVFLKPVLSSTSGLYALLESDVGEATRIWRDFSKDIEEVGIEIESTLFGVLVHELLADLMEGL